MVEVVGSDADATDSSMSAFRDREIASMLAWWIGWSAAAEELLSLGGRGSETAVVTMI